MAGYKYNGTGRDTIEGAIDLSKSDYPARAHPPVMAKKPKVTGGNLKARVNEAIRTETMKHLRNRHYAEYRELMDRIYNDRFEGEPRGTLSQRIGTMSLWVLKEKYSLEYYQIRAAVIPLVYKKYEYTPERRKIEFDERTYLESLVGEE